MNPFRAFRIHEVDRKIVARFDEITLDDLCPGEVVVRVSCSESITRTHSQRRAPDASCASTRWSEASTSPARS